MQIRGLERTVLPEYGCKGIPESAEKAYNAGLKRKARIHSQRKKALYGLKCVILGELIEPNQVLALALAYDVDAIVHEDLRRSLRQVTKVRCRGSCHRGHDGTLSRTSSIGQQVLVSLSSEFTQRGRVGRVPGVVRPVTPANRPTTSKNSGGKFRCDNGVEGDRDYIGALNVARVFFSETDELGHSFRPSYTGGSEIVLAGRSAGTRFTFGTGIVAYEPEQAAATTGGGSAVIATAVVVPESKTDGSSRCGPVVQQCPVSDGVRLKAAENWNGHSGSISAVIVCGKSSSSV